MLLIWCGSNWVVLELLLLTLSVHHRLYLRLSRALNTPLSHWLTHSFTFTASISCNLETFINCLNDWLQLSKFSTEIMITLVCTANHDIALWRKLYWKWEIKEFAKMSTSPHIFKNLNCFRLNIWKQYLASFTFQHVFGPNWSFREVAEEFSQESVEVPAGLLKDVKKWGDQLNRLSKKKRK